MITIRSSTIFMKFTIQGFLGAKTRSNYDSFSENLPKKFKSKDDLCIKYEKVFNL